MKSPLETFTASKIGTDSYVTLVFSKLLNFLKRYPSQKKSKLKPETGTDKPKIGYY